MDLIERIVKLLDDETPRKRIAAAVVLGELGVKDAKAVARLCELAKDPNDAYAEAALEALGQVGSVKALPVLLDALGRGREVQAAAKVAIGKLGEEALPFLRERLDQATPEARAVLSTLLPSVGGRQSFELALEGMRGQTWEAVNPVALSVRQEAKTMSEAEKKVMRTQVEKFLAKKKTAEDEPATRGALKVLGYLELADSADTLLGYLGAKQPPAVRMEAAMALRFALSKGPSKKALRRLMELLEDEDVQVARASRDTLTVMKIGTEFAEELAELSKGRDVEVAKWAIAHLGGLALSEPGKSAKLAVKTLVPMAQSNDKLRAEAAAKALLALPGGVDELVDALLSVEEEVGAQVLADALAPHATKLGKKAVQSLLAAGTKTLGDSLAVARRQLEPVRIADKDAWAELIREKAKAFRKKDPTKAEALLELLGRSGAATNEDRFGVVVQSLLHHSLDPHPRARQGDSALAELERLHGLGFPVAEALKKDKQLTDEARYYVGVHFAEKSTFELKNVGAELLEALAEKGKGKIAKAAKNKMKLLEL
jgi:HEAT repeat protein